MKLQRPAKRYADEAAGYFLRGYNCAQSTAVVFAHPFGLEPNLVLNMTAGFGGGIGGLRQTCGAVSVMAWAAGLCVGDYGPDDLAVKTALYNLVKQMRAEFVKRHGSDCCRDLLERAGLVAGPRPSKRDDDYYATRPCAGLVVSAAEIIASTLLARQGCALECTLHSAASNKEVMQDHDSNDASKDKAFQDYYPDNLSHCYGCGRLNADGLQIKTYWEGDESITRYLPRPYHTAIPGFVYGGLLASLVDCHGTGTAAAAAYRAEGRAMDSEPAFRYVTASLHVDYLKPTPSGVVLELRGRVKEIKGRKVIVEINLLAEGIATVRGEVVAVQMPKAFLPG